MNKRNDVGDVLSDPRLGNNEWVVVHAHHLEACADEPSLANRWKITLMMLFPGTDHIDWNVSQQEFYQDGEPLDNCMLLNPTHVRRMFQKEDPHRWINKTTTPIRKE